MHFPKLRKFILFLLTLLLLLALSACGGEDEVEEGTEENSTEEGVEGVEVTEEPAPTSMYLIGGENVPGLSATGEAVVGTYTYTGVDDSNTLVEIYMGQMTTKENGFYTVGADYLKADAPDFSTPEGTLYLARAVVDDAERILVMKLDWAEGSCTVTTSVEEKPEEPRAQSTNPISRAETRDLIMELLPSDLGLAGESMAEYNFYFEEALTLIDGVTCRCFNVYTVGETAHTNEYVGTYFISGDGVKIYIQGEDKTVSLIS